MFILFSYSHLKAKSTYSVLSLQSTLHVPASLRVPRYPLNLSSGRLESSLAFFLLEISRDSRHIFFLILSPESVATALLIYKQENSRGKLLLCV